MRHVEEDELILFHYGELDEAGDASRIRRHLEECTVCTAEYESLATFLGEVTPAAVPERDDDYGDRVWTKLAPRLRKPAVDWRAWFTLPRLAMAGTMAALLVAAFLYGNQRGREESLEALTAEARQRILMHAVGEHLEKSERVLVELTNTPAGDGVDLGDQRRRAQRLASTNRIYRTTARNTGQETMADLLDELERVLLEIANSPETLDAAEFNRLWRRVEGSGLLIKLKLMESETRKPVQAPQGTPATRT